MFLIRLDYSFAPSSSGLTHLCLAFAEIASKQGHHDVSKLTPTDIAIEVSLPRIPFLFPVSTHHQTAFYKITLLTSSQSLHKIESFVSEHTPDNPASDSQAESQIQRIQTL